MTKKYPQQNHTRLVFILCCGILFMFGFCYLLVPFYTLLCKELGINGKGATVAAKAPNFASIDTTRTIQVEFTTVVNGKLSFIFKPEQRHLTLHPGERKLIYFYAENTSGHDIIVQAIPSITPNDGARFLKKTECFCFTQQFFRKNEKAKMPVYFFIDPEIEKEIQELTLSYTLFDASQYVRNEKHFTKGRIEL